MRWFTKMNYGGPILTDKILDIAEKVIEKSIRSGY